MSVVWTDGLLRLWPKKPTEPPQGVITRPYIPEDRALGCLDCRAIYAAESDLGCPACGSHQAFALGRALGARRAG